MPLTFEPISDAAQLKQQGAYRRLLSGCPGITSDYSFLNLWGWAEEYGLQWAWQDDLVWIRQQRPQPCLWAPIGAWHQIDWRKRIQRVFSTAPETFIRVPEPLAGILKDALGASVTCHNTRSHWDYLYRTDDLADLSGNRFHKKKNLVNQFVKRYDFQFIRLGPKFANEAMAMQEDWCLWRDCESIEALAAENRVIRRVFDQWHALAGIMGGGLVVDGRLVAYTIGEALEKRHLIIHFEKGNTDYKGVYQAINQLFVQSVRSDFDTVNREQDLGDEGLRKAKMSYQPVGFLEKYDLVYTPD